MACSSLEILNCSHDLTKLTKQQKFFIKKGHKIEFSLNIFVVYII